jgi:hypothetical protein
MKLYSPKDEISIQNMVEFLNTFYLFHMNNKIERDKDNFMNQSKHEFI